MTQSSWPFEGVDTTETQYSRLLRHIGQGVNGVPGDNNLLAYADSTGMNVKVKVSGGNSQAIIRGHMYQSTAEETLSISTASTSPRIDLVVLRLDPSVNSIVLAVVTGTPATSPVAPSLTQTDTAIFEMLIAQVSVPASATTISAGNVLDKRTFIGNVWTSSTRPDALLGLTGYNATTSKLETWTGSSWVEVTPTALDASVITSGTINAARLGTIAVSKGGTGATDASTARTNLAITPANIGAALTSHTHSILKSPSDSYTFQVNNLGNTYITRNSDSYITFNIEGSTGEIIRGTLTQDKVTGTWTKGVDTTSNITTSGQVYGASMLTPTISGGTDWNIGDDGGGRFNAGLQSSGVYNTAVSGLAVYVSSGGTIGKGASTKRVKNDIVDADLDIQAIQNIRIRNFTYKPEMVESDGSVQVGVIAEELIELGLSQFVFFEEDGQPSGVHYDKLALAALALLQSQIERIDAIEARLAFLEK